MKLLTRVLFVLFVLAGVLIAVSNREPVQLGLWPLPQVVVTPLYLVILATLLIGIMAGLGLGWWAGRHQRRRARANRGEAQRLDRENARLRETIASQAPATVVSAPAAREQRAIDRQAALVAPELMLAKRASSA